MLNFFKSQPQKAIYYITAFRLYDTLKNAKTIYKEQEVSSKRKT